MTGIIFPVITFPYAARVLLPEGLGTINFLQSIVNYIVLFTSLGIPMYAVREVARFRDDIAKRNIKTVEIILLSVILCIAGYVAVWILGATVPKIHSNLSIFYVLSLSIIFTSIGVNWFYQAVEDFKYITIRALVFRIASASCLFLFVKDSDDLLIYALVVIGSTVGNNFINFIHLRKFIDFRKIRWKQLNVFQHLKPALHIFVFNLITSIYLNLNTVMLGFINGEKAVGYYSSGYKISQILLSVITSLGVVLLPRCSNLIETGKNEEFANITRKSYHLILALSLPLTAGLLLLAQPIVRIFFGPAFSESVSVVMWTASIIIFVGLSNVIGLQILYPQGKENLVIWSTAGGALFCIVLNLALLPVMSYTGAAISTFVAELAVLVIQIIFGRKYIPFMLIDKSVLNYVIGTILLSAAVISVMAVCNDVWTKVFVSLVAGILIYSLYLHAVKDPLFRETIIYVLRRKNIK